MPISFKQQAAAKSARRAPTISMPGSGRKNTVVYILTNGTVSGTGASADSIVALGIVPYAVWRVIGVGCIVRTNSASTIAEQVNFGIGLSDIGSTDDDYFSSLVQDVTAGKNWLAGDMHMNPMNIQNIKIPDASANGGTHNWTAGNPDGIGVWQTKMAWIIMTKKTVASSTGTVSGFVIIEAAI